MILTWIDSDNRLPPLTPSAAPDACQNGRASGAFNGHSRTVLIVASLDQSRLRDCPRRPLKEQAS